MNIIIPVCGKGERFKNNGYIIPKPLIKIFDKEMIFYVLDNLKIIQDDKIFIIYYNLDNLEIIINNKYSNINFIKLDYQTSGATETILLGLNKIINLTDNKKCLILDCDTFYTEDILNMYRHIDSNALFYTNNYDEKPIFSYIKLKNDIIYEIREKTKISDYVNTGIYCFNDIKELHYYAKFIVENNIKFNNEYYLSCLIDKMLSDNKIFKGIKLNNNYVFNLGTPEQLNTYINNTYLFLFDLDGTLVLTDDIYFDVWKLILKDYNINLNNEIFKNYIQGNSDGTVLRTLLPNKFNIILNDISNIKDELFIQNINKLKIIDNAINFINNIKSNGHKIAIVTNCNRKVAEEILKYIDIF